MSLALASDSQIILDVVYVNVKCCKKSVFAK
jgi:hypothetical protein